MYIHDISKPNYPELYKTIEAKLKVFIDPDAIEDLNIALVKMKMEQKAQ